MSGYWMVRLGFGGDMAEEMIDAGCIGVDWGIDFDIRPYLGGGSEGFRRVMNDLWLDRNPGSKRIVAGKVMSMLWTAAEGMQKGDTVITRKADRTYASGTVVGDYEYSPGGALPHRRRVQWRAETFTQDELSPDLAAALQRRVTVFPLAEHAAELARLTGAGDSTLPLAAVPLAAAQAAEAVEEQVAFQMEKQLEDFLVQNWRNTSIGRDYDIYEEDGEVVGQQYPTDTGPMDILAVSKDGKRLLVVELKRGRASDSVVGQIQRYMGYAKERLLEPGQSVEGLIIAREDDTRIRRALSVAQGIRFMKYHVDFRLE